MRSRLLASIVLATAACTQQAPPQTPEPQRPSVTDVDYALLYHYVSTYGFEASEGDANLRQSSTAETTDDVYVDWPESLDGFFSSLYRVGAEGQATELFNKVVALAEENEALRAQPHQGITRTRWRTRVDTVYIQDAHLVAGASSTCPAPSSPATPPLPAEEFALRIGEDYLVFPTMDAVCNLEQRKCIRLSELLADPLSPRERDGVRVYRTGESPISRREP